MKLIVEIDGKAALPVRAIPYASGDPGELIHPGMLEILVALLVTLKTPMRYLAPFV